MLRETQELKLEGLEVRRGHSPFLNSNSYQKDLYTSKISIFLVLTFKKEEVE